MKIKHPKGHLIDVPKHLEKQVRKHVKEGNHKALSSLFDKDQDRDSPMSDNDMDEMKSGGIHIKKSHRGLLHKNLGVKKGEKIPASKLKIKSTDSPAVKKRKQFAINAKKWHHENGGMMEDGGTMYPQNIAGELYEQGGLYTGSFHPFANGGYLPMYENAGMFNAEDPEFRFGDQGFAEQNPGGIDNSTFSDSLRINPMLYQPVKKGNINVPNINQAPNFKQTIDTPQIKPYNFYNPQTGQVNPKPNPWKQFGQDAISQLKNQPIPTMGIPNITGSKHWDMASERLGKATDQFNQAGQAIASGFGGGGFGKKYGGYIPKMFGGGFMAIGNAAAHGASGLGYLGGGIMESTAALLDTAGNFNINNQVRKQEAQDLRQSIFSGNETTPYENFGYSTTGRNPAYYADGGIANYKSYNQGGIANVETENNEVAQIPQTGLIDTMHGLDHSQGGIKMQLPEGTKIFSEKLKDPETKKSYAKLAKKYETKKEIDRIENEDGILDDTNISTSKMMMGMKNKLSDDLFNKQETDKLSGVHGSKVKNEAMKDHGFMKYGGVTKADNGKTTKSFKRYSPETQALIDQGLLQEASPYLDPIENVQHKMGAGHYGAKGKEFDMIDFYQRHPWVKDEYKSYAPNGKGFDPTDPKDVEWFQNTYNVHKNEWNRQHGLPEENYFSQNVGRNPYGVDKKFGQYTWAAPGFNNIGNVNITPQTQQPLVGDQPGVTKFNKLKGSGFNFGDFKPYGFNINIPDTYPRDPIATKQLSPSYITPKYLDIQPELNEQQRGYNSLASNLGSRTGSDIANLLQAQTNKYGQNQRAFSDKYRYDQNQDTNAQQFNANAKMTTDRENLGEFNRFTGDINKREAAITSQKKYDSNAEFQRTLDENAYNQRTNDISHMFNPSKYDTSSASIVYNGLANAEQNNIDSVHFKKVNGRWVADTAIDKTANNKYGGKVGKIKFGKKKK